MYAVVKTGGKQYKVSPGDKLQVEKIDAKEGDQIELNEVLLVSDERGSVEVGQPLLEKAKVQAQVLGQYKGDKTRVYFFRRRKQSERTVGHRQNHTSLLIKSVVDAQGNKNEA
jgi:large subunit ribosomal protein L21